MKFIEFHHGMLNSQCAVGDEGMNAKGTVHRVDWITAGMVLKLSSAFMQPVVDMWQRMWASCQPVIVVS
jgi:hypothetical protein